MKKFLSISLLLAITAAAVNAAPIVAYRPDPEVPQDIKDGIIKNLPEKAYVAPKKPRKVLVFSRTTSVRHYLGITSGKFFWDELAKKTGAFEVVFSDDLENFQPEKLKEFDCVIMNCTTGRVFAELPTTLEKMDASEREAVLKRDEELRANLLEYVKNGGGFLGVHSGSDTYRAAGERWEPYLEMVGGDFIKHPWSKGGVVVCEDTESPITKGIWNDYGVYIADEIYMFGDIYDREKVRVLVSVDVDRSRAASPVREDKDCALVWIKDYGKGRVAYNAFGHSGKSYALGPEIPATFLRLVQFACGDLDADTTSIKKPQTAIAPKLYGMPTMEDVLKYSEIEYGQDIPNVSETILAFYSFNEIDEFRSQTGPMLLDELESMNGTPRYRALLCQFLDAVGINSKESEAKAVAAIAKEKDPTVKSRLENILYKFQNGGEKQPGNKYLPPADMPASDAEIVRALAFLKANRQADMPSWAVFENMSSPNLKAALVYTLAERGEGMDKIRLLKPESGAETLAISYAIAKGGNSADIQKIAQYAAFVDKANQPAFVRNLCAVADPQKFEGLMAMLQSADASEAKLAGDILGASDASAEKQKLIQIFANADSDSAKLACIKVLNNMADAEIFNAFLPYLPAEKGETKVEVCKLLIRASLDGINDETFANVAKAYEKAESDADKKFLIRFAPAASSQAALESCEKAAADGYKAEVLKQIVRWKNDGAKELVKKLSE